MVFCRPDFLLFIVLRNGAAAWPFLDAVPIISSADFVLTPPRWAESSAFDSLSFRAAAYLFRLLKLFRESRICGVCVGEI